jgi:rubredoxin
MERDARITINFGARCGLSTSRALRVFYAEHSEPLGCPCLQPTCDSIMKTWMCLICGWIYDEAAGAPEEGIAPGTRWEDVPMNWTCPECGARKEDFEMIEV